jgi:hypothetical protein
VRVTLQVLDYDGTPLEEAWVRSFSEDYGIQVPNFLMNKTDSSGLLSLRLMNGTWSFFVYGGERYANSKPGYGYFVCLLNHSLQADETFVLRPNITTSISFFNFNGAPLDGEVRAGESNHTPIVLTTTIGSTSNGKIIIYSLPRISIKILMYSLGSNIGYVFLETIRSGDNLSVKAVDREMAKIYMSIKDKDGNPSIGTYFINYNDFDIGDNTGLHPIEVVVNGQYTLYSTPTSITVTSTLQRGWGAYHSVPEDYDLIRDRELTINRGGPFNVSVHIMQDRTQIWLDVRDSFGNLWMNSWPISAPVRIIRDRDVVYAGNLKGFIDYLGMTYQIDDPLDYHITLDIGECGTYILTGRLLSSQSLLKFRTISTKHFDIDVPDVGGKVAERFDKIASFFEVAYDAQSMIMGHGITNKIKVEFPINIIAGVGGSNYIGMATGFSLDHSYRTIPSTFIGVATHELGHVFQHSYPFQPPGWYVSPWFGEPAATWLGNKAIELILSPKHALYDRGRHDNFYLDLLRGSPTSSQLIENIQFLMFYLEKWYGHNILKEFVRLWAFQDAGSLLAQRGFNVNESIVSVFSALVGKNLASIFRQAGLDIQDTRINEGMTIVSQLGLSPLIAGVSSIFAIGVPGPLWALSEDAFPIVSGDEDTTPIPSVVAMATFFGKGRVVALGHDGFLINEALDLFDNKRFGNNIVDWLDSPGTKKMLVATGHREWYGGANFDSFKQELESRGYTVTRFYGQLSASSLSETGVVLIGNAWGDLSQQEIDALKDFVLNGGGLLLMGLGWSWEPYNPGKTLDDYPMNKVGEVFGIRWIDGYISDPTNNYNGQPVFHTFYLNIKLQTLYQAFSHINITTRAHQTDLPYILQDDDVLRRDYVNAHLLIATASRVLSLSSTQRREIYDFYMNLINSNPQYFKKNVVYDRFSQSVMAWLRERVYRSLIDALPLTEDVKSEIALTLGLTDRYLDIWSEFSVLLLDNSGLDQRQKDFIYSYLSIIPKELHNLRTISVVDFLSALPPSTPEIYLWGREGSVNIFGAQIGEYEGNEFPDGVPPKYSDSFCIVVAHEVNHVVDAYYVSRNQALRERKDELIRQAGENHMNYLRSMLPDGFFVSAPQEFFASIANQWFSDTNLTLRLALTRFDKGYREPLNQFLFFAEVYSRGGSNTLFYSIDTQGNLQRRQISILRDQNGRINAIIDGAKKYFFNLDDHGNIVSYSIKEVVFHRVSIDVQPKVADVKIDDAQYSREQFPLVFEWMEDSTHAIEIPVTVQPQPNVRYVFEGWSDGVSSARRIITVSSPVSYFAKYRSELLISINSPYGTFSGGGWCENGSIITVSVSETIVDHGNGTRRVFKGWFENSSLVSDRQSFSVTVNRPMIIDAHWSTEYEVSASSPYGIVSGGGWCDADSNVTLSINQTVIEYGNGTRFIFICWSGDLASRNPTITFRVEKPATLNALWKKQYYLEVQTNYGTATPGSGWYDTGVTIHIKAEPPSAVQGERYVWGGWVGAGDGSYSGMDNPATITLNSPISQKASWKHQFYLRVESAYGDLKGEGWYNEGETASFSVASPVGFLIQQVFIGWGGDVKTAEPKATIIMDGPKNVIAYWRTDYTQLYTLVAGVAIIAAAIILVVRYKGKS